MAVFQLTFGFNGCVLAHIWFQWLWLTFGMLHTGTAGTNGQQHDVCADCTDPKPA